MKNILFVIVIICCGILAGYPASGQQTNDVSGSINFVTAPVDKVLDVYKDLAKVQLIVASNVRQVHHTITLHATNLSGEVLRQMIQDTLLKQAGIVITPIDDKRVSVTYNDQLKL